MTKTTIDEKLKKCDFIDGSILNGIREPILYSFTVDTPTAFKILSQPETEHYKNLNKSVLNYVTIYLEHNDRNSFDFKGETITFT